MITLDEAAVSFVLRVAGVALHSGRVLLQRAEGESFWALPGGRGELLEPARQTLVREMAEELHVVVTPGRWRGWWRTSSSFNVGPGTNWGCTS